MKPRIFVGTTEIAKLTFNITRGFRELGYEVDSLVWPNELNRHYPDAVYDMHDASFIHETSFFAKAHGRVGIKTSRAFAEFVKRYDIFVFFASRSLFRRGMDLPALKAMGKTIIMRQGGSEVRDMCLAADFWEALGLPYPVYQHYPEEKRKKTETEYDIFNLPRYHPAFASKVHNVRMSERYADAIFSAPLSQTLGLRPYFQSGPVFNADEFTFRVPRRAVPVILHAPTNMEFKGTEDIVDALEELRREGVAFRFVILNGVSHEQVREQLADADILVDQLGCGAGILAYEGMASGCAVLGGHTEAASPLPRHRPIFHVTRENLKERLRMVIDDVDLRTQLAVKGREFVGKGLGSPAVVAQYMLDAVERDRRGDADIYPVQFARCAEIPERENVPQYLKDMTLDVLLRHGAHPDIDLHRLVAAGFLQDGATRRFNDIPRWDASRLQQDGPWVLTGPGATFGMDEASVAVS